MNADVLRILDANANRAREAMRAIEDYARFVLNDDTLCGALKHLRHDLARATATFISDAILFRDTPGDVGTTIKTPSELEREDLKQVVTASGKRLGEALRTIEEFVKTINPTIASQIEQIRYRGYTIEQQIAQTLRPTTCAFTKVRLYVLITQARCSCPWIEAAERAIDGGADCIQLREKELESGELVKCARQIVQLCRKHGVISIINDRPDIAILSEADGVHVGQGDLPATDVRKLIGRNKIVGVSTHNLEQARRAVRDGADYIGVGPVFKSSTKPREFLPGLDVARQIAQAKLPIPAIAIAGITLQNVDEVIRTGVQAVAVTAAVVGAPDVRAAATQFKERFEAIKREKDVPSSSANH